VGVGVVNQKDDHVATVDTVATRARHAVRVFGAERVLLAPDCGFATFADNPIAPAARAEATLRALAEAAALVGRG
jgi:5-methyltetrahydropteroyltriglutamate--homocysteine methyltransferase